MIQFAVTGSSSPEKTIANVIGEDSASSSDGETMMSTPVSRKRKRTRSTLGSFTPRSGSRAHDASRLFRVKFATTNPFPYISDAQELAWKAYAESRPPLAEDEPSQDLLLNKMKKNVQFAKENLQVVCYESLHLNFELIYPKILRGTSQLRGELKDKARTAVLSHYITPIGNNRRLRKDKVCWLLEENIFVFGGIDLQVVLIYSDILKTLLIITQSCYFDKKQPFVHPILSELIHKQWFSESTSEGPKNRAAFNPIPMEIICLVATAVMSTD